MAPASALWLLPLLASAAIAGSVPSIDAAASIERLPQVLTCPIGDGWMHFGGSCYKLYKQQEYWYPAEQQCQSVGGHLVSINSRLENAFVGKLTYCESAWTGGYALDIRKLTDISNYDWTDGSSARYNAHNFSSIQHIHEPLLKSCNLQLINNVYHAKNEFVCEIPARNMSQSCECDNGWRFVDGNCYIMPNFKASYVEAMYYCSGRDASLASVHDEDEVRAISLIDIDSYACPVETWIGLVKLNPCRAEYSGSKSNASSCFQWYDRSGDFKNFPSWMQGSPDQGEVVNCVYIRGQQIGTEVCYARNKFVCKKPAAKK